MTVVVDEPIEIAGMTQSDSGDLTKQVYEIIANRVGEMGGRIAL